LFVNTPNDIFVGINAEWNKGNTGI
jgi:hypothetical protein